MVIFRIIFNLSRILIGLFLRVAWLPLLLIKRHLFIVILIVLGFVIYAQFNDSKTPTQLTPGTAAQPQQRSAQAPRQAPQPVEAVRTREDGNSAFATDLYALMDDEQRGYYSQFFFWAMNHLPDGQTQGWANGNTEGSFTVTRTFLNASGASCRNFTEVLKVRHIEQTLSGVACPRGADGGWCKLKPNATAACGLGGKPGFWDSLKNLF